MSINIFQNPNISVFVYLQVLLTLRFENIGLKLSPVIAWRTVVAAHPRIFIFSCHPTSKLGSSLPDNLDKNKQFNSLV